MQRLLNGLAGLPTIDDLKILRLDAIVGLLQGVVDESVADHRHAVVVEVELVGFRVIEQCLLDLPVDSVGVTQVTADIALQKLIAVLVEQACNFVYGQTPH